MAQQYGTLLRIRAVQLPRFKGFGLFWFTFWSLGGLAMLSKSTGTLLQDQQPAAFEWIWLIGWAAGWSWMACMLAWTFWGEELVTIAGAQLSIRQCIGRFGREKHYAVANIQHLSATADDDYNEVRTGLNFQPPRLTGGALQFSYGMRTVRFGLQMEAAEAIAVLEELRQQKSLPMACFTPA
ncbi:hypothetical protein [Hymenobacter canadensis]|uniref:PH domain-containing protein n=1 Tax=Hymenobacter canadensis TaxID=2999067 RepID=A0ABY7LQB9_9BACT|nr:hypothetical protein [Hymenobacter canadensis]WBA42613.1 hypothetical protein O3303_03410 [Hymenobacter canadensis]